LAACQLLPGIELLGLSRRGAGMGLDETLRFSYAWRDLVQWVSPVLVPWRDFNPAVDWTKSSYVGFVGAFALVLGLCRLDRRRAAGLAALLGLVLFLILGDTLPAARAVWTHFGPLRFVRYPGNLSYLGWPVAALLVAAGCQSLRRSWRAPFFLLLAGELLLYAQGQAPLADRNLFTDSGPLVSWLRQQDRGLRYLLSPLALESHSGFGIKDWKWRLYGLTNDPYRLRAAGNFGEPLVPRLSYDLMDLLYRQRSAVEAARLLPGVGVGFLLTRDPLPQTGLLEYEGAMLWHVYRVNGPASLAWGLDERTGDSLPEGLPGGPLPASARPLSLTWTREDRYEVIGRYPGWAFIAEPRYPGWKAVLESGGLSQSVRTLPAWGAFEKARVPAGPWRLRFIYDPGSSRRGVVLSLLSLLACGLYWYNLALRRARQGFALARE
jgi:hypothetical protein